jgi:hypothetical protein
LGAIGVALLGSISDNRSAALEAAGASTPKALLGGYHLAVWVAVGCAAAATLISGRRADELGPESRPEDAPAASTS